MTRPGVSSCPSSSRSVIVPGMTTNETTPATVALVGRGRKVHGLYVTRTRADGSHSYATHCGAEGRNLANRSTSAMIVSARGVVDCAACLRVMAQDTARQATR